MDVPYTSCHKTFSLSVPLNVAFRISHYTCLVLLSCCFRTVFARNRDTAVPTEGNGDLQTLICVLVVRPKRCYIVKSCPLTKLSGATASVQTFTFTFT